MKTFENIDAKSVKQAAALLQKFQQEKKSAIVVSGGSEILQLMKERVITPDYVVNLKTIPGLNTIKEERGGFRIGALTTLAEIEEHAVIHGHAVAKHKALGARFVGVGDFRLKGRSSLGSLDNDRLNPESRGPVGSHLAMRQ